MEKNLPVILSGVIISIIGALMFLFIPWDTLPGFGTSITTPTLVNYAGATIAIIGLLVIIIGIFMRRRKPP